MPPHKKALGYRTSTDKFAQAGLTRQSSVRVRPERIRECPIQLEATVQAMHEFAQHDPRLAVSACAVEVRIRHIHVESELLDADHPHRIDPDKWRPLIMSFRQFYGLAGRIRSSRLGVVPEEVYAPWKNQKIGD